MCRELAFALMVVPCWAASSWGQVHQTTGLRGVTRTAFGYFDQVEGRRFDEFLRNLRPEKLSPERKAHVLKLVPQVDVVSAPGGQQAKLRALGPIFHYHDRDSAIEVILLRVQPATAALLSGAAILITEPALEILSAGELQAMVAHELGHEYFWDEFELARQQGEYFKLQELELRCDGIAVITLNQLGLNPESLLRSVRKLNRYNGHEARGVQADRYVPLQEREEFIRSMIRMVRKNRPTP